MSTTCLCQVVDSRILTSCPRGCFDPQPDTLGCADAAWCGVLRPSASSGSWTRGRRRTALVVRSFAFRCVGPVAGPCSTGGRSSLRGARRASGLARMRSLRRRSGYPVRRLRRGAGRRLTACRGTTTSRRSGRGCRRRATHRRSTSVGRRGCGLLRRRRRLRGLMSRRRGFRSPVCPFVRRFVGRRRAPVRLRVPSRRLRRCWSRMSINGPRSLQPSQVGAGSGVSRTTTRSNGAR
jgi:hypothetical protein